MENRRSVGKIQGTILAHKSLAYINNNFSKINTVKSTRKKSHSMIRNCSLHKKSRIDRSLLFFFWSPFNDKPIASTFRCNRYTRQRVNANDAFFFHWVRDSGWTREKKGLRTFQQNRRSAIEKYIKIRQFVAMYKFIFLPLYRGTLSPKDSKPVSHLYHMRM